MPIGKWGNDDVPLLSGLWGTFQSQAAQYASTSSVWTALRVNAAVWQHQAQGGGDLPPVEELEAQGAAILKTQGVDALKVGTYRSLANEWRSAKQNLAGQGQDTQILGTSIFTPPWAQTTDRTVPSRYRIRMQFDAVTPDGSEFNTWGTFELNSPLTTMADAIAQATALVGKKPTSDTPLGSSVTSVNDYEIEQI